MLSPKTQRNISRIIPFGLIWFVFGLFYALIEKGILGELDYHPSTGIPYEFEISLLFSLSYAVVGLFIGSIEILYLNNQFINKSFGQKILYKTLIYVLMNFTITVIAYSSGTALELQTSLYDPLVWDRLGIFLSNFAYLSVEIYTALTLGVSLFYFEISENIGQGVLKNFFTGKYHRPNIEDRIFMFLDMKSSTTIAEKLGHVKYFKMLSEYYSDLSESIIKYSGEIYQYVGDEIIVSWKLENGIRSNNCIQCYSDMKKNLKNQAEKYHKKFDVVPTFKVGFHVGEVTTGEIGVIKKDIIFTGDVLNTTARIQGLCNDYKVDLLISADLIKKLDLNSDSQIRSLGKKELRGRKESVELFTILS